MRANSSLQDIQKELLKITDAFIDFCNKNNLQWFADSGTLLGAIRHGGFIPWDDDIDIAMPRKDYDRLLEMTKDGSNPFEEPYFLQTIYNGCEFSTNMQLRKSDTTKLRHYELHKYMRKRGKFLANKGLAIDIVPIDYLPFELSRKLTLSHTLNFVQNYYGLRTVSYLQWNKYLEQQRFANALNMFEDVLRKFPDDLNFTPQHPRTETKHVFVSSWMGTKRYFGSYVLETDYADYIELDFTGLRNKIRVPVGYDNILKVYYNDYMVEDRFGALHDNEHCIYDTEKSFREYEDLDNQQLLFMIDNNLRK